MLFERKTIPLSRFSCQSNEVGPEYGHRFCYRKIHGLVRNDCKIEIPIRIIKKTPETTQVINNVECFRGFSCIFAWKNEYMKIGCANI